jgi:hypothetical protein
MSRGFPLASFSFRPRDEAAVEFIDSLVEQANQPRQELEPQWYENWANYRVESLMGSYPDKRYPSATGYGNRFEMSPINSLKTPESHQGVNTLRALLLSGLFGTRDYVQADPVGDEDIDKAKRVSKLVMYGLERPGMFRTNWEVTGDSLIFGLGSYSSRWKNITRVVPRRMPVPDPLNPGDFLRNPQTGAIMTVLQNVPASVYDDVTNETDDLFDTWFDPAANRFQDCKFKIKRFQMHEDELRACMSDPENWDAEGIGRLLETESSGSRVTGPDQTDHPKLITENLTLEDIKQVEEYGYYGGWSFEGYTPPDVAEDVGEIDPNSTNVLRIINGICIQAKASPQRNGLLQGGTMTILPTGRGVYGISPLTIVRYLQDVSDTQLILTVQAMIESVYQNYLISGDQGPNFQRDLETRRAREAFVVQGEVDQIQPLPRDYGGLQIAAGALQMLSQTMRNAMNARDPVQGIQRQTGDATATETQTVTAAALQNTDQLAILIERDELPTMGMLINDLYYVNLDDEGKIFRRVGETETTAVNYFDIDAVTDITFVGARSLLSRQAKSNQFRDFATVLASNPLTAASTDWHALVARWGDEGFDLKGLDQLMLKDPEEIVARMQSMGLPNTVKPAGGGGAGPDGGAPPAKGRSNPANGGGRGGLVAAQQAGEAA